jgi:hypothetical protein
MSRRAGDRRMFSVYIYGRAKGNGDVLKVGYVVEQGTRVREELKVYMKPRGGDWGCAGSVRRDRSEL